MTMRVPMTIFRYVLLALAVGSTSIRGWGSQPTDQGFFRPRTMKRCSKCKKNLPLPEFYKASAHKDGLQGECKNCGPQRHRKYYQSHRPEYAERQRKYTKKHSAKVKEWKRKYSQTHKAEIAKWQHKYRKAHLQERRAKEQLRRAKKFGGTIELFADNEIFDRDGWICQICRKRVGKALKYPHPRSASLDHIVSLSKGGDHTRINVQLAHLVCNTKKRDRWYGQLRLMG